MVVAVEELYCSYCHQQTEIEANVIVLMPCCANGADWLLYEEGFTNAVSLISTTWQNSQKCN
jgi:hypothetical protein